MLRRSMKPCNDNVVTLYERHGEEPSSLDRNPESPMFSLIYYTLSALKAARATA